MINRNNNNETSQYSNYENYLDLRNIDKACDYAKLKDAGNIIRNGGLVLFPTETVYGLGANGLDTEAVKKIYIAKGRSSDNPLILHICDIEMLSKIAKDISDIEFSLMNAFWPGPFTIILNKTDIVPLTVSGGLQTVGVRMPSNDIARNLIKYSEVPIAAPSANISGRPSGTNIHDIFPELASKVNYIIDGGDCNIGLESTVVRVIDGIPHILRPGKITAEDIKAVAGDVVVDSHVLGKLEPNAKVLSPGMKYRHYAPSTKCVMVYSENNEKIKAKIESLASDKKNKKVVIMCLSNNVKELQEKLGEEVEILDMGENLEEMSKNVFTDLRKADTFDADLIIVQGVSSDGLGLAIMNRLLRACSYNIYRC